MGEELEETELYPFVGSDGLGAAGQGSPTAGHCGGAPARGSGGVVVGELHRAMGKLVRRLARAE